MVQRKTKDTPSDREMQVMSVVWKLRQPTVAEVQQELNELWEPEVAYNTVLTHLRSLRAKGWLTTVDEGRAHRYLPAVSRSYARFLALTDLKDVLFEGSTEQLLTELVSDRKLTPATLQRLRLLLDERLKLKGKRP